MSGKRIISEAWWTLALLCASRSWADSPANVRKPLGIYAKVDIDDAISGYPGAATPAPAQLHSYLRGVYANLLADPAISGISLGAHWDEIELTGASDSSGYDWNYLDDGFA